MCMGNSQMHEYAKDSEATLGIHDILDKGEKQRRGIGSQKLRESRTPLSGNSLLVATDPCLEPSYLPYLLQVRLG